MANLYTKTGDKGKTSLYGGSRVAKNSMRVECYGTIDEANSMLGLAYALSENQAVRKLVNQIQIRLFSVGAELASDAGGAEMLKAKVTEEDVRNLEKNRGWLYGDQWKADGIRGPRCKQSLRGAALCPDDHPAGGAADRGPRR